jgi:hypothetical protein
MVRFDTIINTDTDTDASEGEVYVLNDGGEVDLDLGNYERYLDVTLSRDNNITTGKVYREVIEKERKGEYLGKTVQVSTVYNGFDRNEIDHLDSLWHRLSLMSQMLSRTGYNACQRFQLMILAKNRTCVS